jgi:hypothetical protein
VSLLDAAAGAASGSTTTSYTTTPTTTPDGDSGWASDADIGCGARRMNGHGAPSHDGSTESTAPNPTDGEQS